MAIQFPCGFNIRSNEPIDARLVLTAAQMRTAHLDYLMPDKYIALCSTDGKLYIYDRHNDVLGSTGRFRLLKDNTPISDNETINVEVNPNNETQYILSVRGKDEAVNQAVLRKHIIDGEVSYSWDAIYDKVQVDSFLAQKVDKEANKSLMSAAEHEKLAGIPATATVVENSSINGNIIVDDAETTVYTEPSDVVHDASYVHTDNNFTDAEVTKLAGIQANAEVNSIIDVQVRTDNGSNYNSVLDNKVAQIDLSGKENIIGPSHKISLEYTEETAGRKWFTTTDKNKLNNIESGAQVNNITSIKVNNVTQEIVDKTVNIAVPTGALAALNQVSEENLVSALWEKIHSHGSQEQVTLLNNITANNLLTAEQREAIAAVAGKQDALAWAGNYVYDATNNKVVTDQYLTSIISTVKQFNYQVTQTLPEAIKANMGIIWLYKPAGLDAYDEYLIIEPTTGTYVREKLGTAQIDLSQYYTKSEVNSMIDGINGALANKVDAENGKSLIETTKITKLDGIASGAQVNIIESIKVNNTEITPDANKAVDIIIDTSNFATKDELGSLANVARTGNYSDLTDKPDIPAAVTEQTVSDWGFSEIPASDSIGKILKATGLTQGAFAWGEDTIDSSFTVTNPVGGWNLGDTITADMTIKYILCKLLKTAALPEFILNTSSVTNCTVLKDSGTWTTGNSGTVELIPANGYVLLHDITAANLEGATFESYTTSSGIMSFNDITGNIIIKDITCEPKRVTSIAVAAAPSDIKYTTDNTVFKRNGLTLTATYNDRSTATIQGNDGRVSIPNVVVNTANLDTTQSYTITYTETDITGSSISETTTQDIQIVKTVTNLTVKTPGKEVYDIGDSLDLSEWVLEAIYNNLNDSKAEVDTGSNPANGTTLTTSMTQVTFSYTYTSTFGDSSTQTTNANITVNPTIILVNSITIDSEPSAALHVGDTHQLTATVLPANATDKAINWTSSDISVATVSSTGLITALAVGNTTITAAAHDGSGVSNTCSIEVVAVPVTGVAVKYGGTGVYVVGTGLPPDDSDYDSSWLTHDIANLTEISVAEEDLLSPTGYSLTVGPMASSHPDTDEDIGSYGDDPDAGQYATIILPNTYQITSLVHTASALALSYRLKTVGDYNLYYISQAYYRKNTSIGITIKVSK